ncbi:MAG: carbohydrate-binding protein [Clostridium sp.]|nr:carbohydrate-binding protein [Clostridium sp.]
MEKITIAVVNAAGCKLFEASGYQRVEMEFERVYQKGDKIQIVLKEERFLKIRLDEAVDEALVFGKKGTFQYLIPDEEGKMAYPPEAFGGKTHKVYAEYQEAESGRVNLSQNSWDIRGESNFYPHCTATIETRGESVFAARNTIDGMTQAKGHGLWPFTSWGEGEDPDAEIRIDFGRKVLAEELEIFLRADFPHDNYWKEAELKFSNGEVVNLALEKTGEGQKFALGGIPTEWIVMGKLRKDENDPSPFPALTQWRVFGRNIL